MHAKASSAPTATRAVAAFCRPCRCRAACGPAGACAGRQATRCRWARRCSAAPPIGSVSHKSGRSGELLFVLVEHAYSNDQGLALTEEHDIVYRAAAQPGDPAPTPQKPPLDGQQTWSRTIVPTTCCCSATRP